MNRRIVQRNQVAALEGHLIVLERENLELNEKICELNMKICELSDEISKLNEENERSLNEQITWQTRFFSQGSELVGLRSQFQNLQYQYQSQQYVSYPPNNYVPSPFLMCPPVPSILPLSVMGQQALSPAASQYSNIQRPVFPAPVVPISSAISMERSKLESFEDRVFKLPSQGVHEVAKLDPLRKFLDEDEEAERYFQQFVPYIMEEVRADISAQIRTIEKRNLKPFTVEIVKREGETGRGYQSRQYIELIGHSKDLPKLDHKFYCEAVLIVSEESRQQAKYWTGGKKKSDNFCGVLAIARVDIVDDEDSGWEGIKLKMPMKDYENHFQQHSNKKSFQIHVHHLCGLIPSSRMYQACSQRPKVDFESQFVYGRPLNSNTPMIDHGDDIGPLLSERCNDGQRKVLQTLGQASAGLYCLQGPPGTGKTTTVVNLLQLWVSLHKEERILLSASTNEAVRVVLMQSQKQFPHVYMALTGVAKHLPPDLEKYFVSQYAQRLYQPLQKTLQKNKYSPMTFEQCKVVLEKAHSDIIKELAELIHSETMTPMTIKTEIKRQVTELHDNLQLLTEKDATTYEQVVQTLEDTVGLLKRASKSLETFLLQRAQIVFSTLVSAGGKTLATSSLNFHRLIIDEASQALIPATFIPLLHFNPKVCVHVGDPMQLPAVVTSMTAQAGGYDTSLMSWLMEEKEKDEEAEEGDEGYNNHNEYQMMLDTQYRMHPEICRLPSEKYYKGALITPDAVLDRPSILRSRGEIGTETAAAAAREESVSSSFFQKPCVFFNIQGKEDRLQCSYNASISNQREAQFIVDTLKYLLMDVGYEGGQIGVITFYAEQVRLITRGFEAMLKNQQQQQQQSHRNNQHKNSSSSYKKVLIATVDGFQGGERDIILISTVRTSNSVGFLNDPRRINVAATRAKHARYFFGNVKSLMESNSDMAAFVDHHQRAGTVVKEEELASMIGGRVGRSPW